VLYVVSAFYACRQVHVGISAHQKLDKLLEVVKLIGYQSLCIFGDCFDEVTLLDPVTYPGAIKQFAKEVRTWSQDPTE
jgi:hypothetical protein